MQEKACFRVVYPVVAVPIQEFLHDACTVALVAYGEFQRLQRARKISEIEIVTDTLQGTLKEPSSGACCKPSEAPTTAY